MAQKGDTNAMLEYGKLLISGYGGSKCEKEGLQFIKKAADIGNIDAIYEYIMELG